MSKYIKWLKDLNKNSISQAGGKGANLGEMYNNGFPVPIAFVVVADAYWDFIIKTRAKEEIEDLLSRLDVNNTEQLTDICNQIQKIIINSKMPDEIAQEIKEAYLQLAAGGPEKAKMLSNNKVGGLLNMSKELPFVAIRSSATAEDLPNASFAGQQATFLNVKGTSNVVDFVKKCWASLFTARSTFYREKNKFDHMKVKIAVIIEKMVDSDKSGVAFSHDPNTGAKTIIIEGAWGLGEMVVSGKVNPDNYVVDYENLNILNKKIMKQKVMMIKDPLTGKSLITEVPFKKQEAQVLTDNEIINLAKLIKRISEHYNSPQDIEWAIEDGRIFIIQSRPITTIRKTEASKPEEVETSKPILEGLAASPGVVSGVVRIVTDLNEASRTFKEGEILVTKMTDPDFVPLMEKAKAIITNEGGLTSHAAIVSREMSVPCIVGTSKATMVLRTGDKIKVDANNGKIYRISEEISQTTPEALTETPEVISEKTSGMPAEEKTIEQEVKTESAPELSSEKAQKIITATKIYMNLGLPDMAEKYKNLPIDGIGLMREEFIITSELKQHPLELINKGESNKFVQALVQGITKVCKAFYPKPVILRFSDFKTNEYRDMEGGEKYEPEEHNPMIGWRGCSRYVSPEFKKVFELELEAVKIVRQSFKNLYVMFPFVRTIKELEEVIEIMNSHGLRRSNDFKVYIMAEVPSNILLAEEFSEYCDGFSIGSNDLTQLILGVDRDSTILAKTGMYNELNPAVIKAIKQLIKSAHSKNKTVSICGQAPSIYPEFAEILVRAGIDSISVNPDAVIKVMNEVARVERKLLLKKGIDEIPGEIVDKRIEEENKDVMSVSEDNDFEETEAEKLSNDITEDYINLDDSNLNDSIEVRNEENIDENYVDLTEEPDFYIDEEKHEDNEENSKEDNEVSNEYVEQEELNNDDIVMDEGVEEENSTENEISENSENEAEEDLNNELDNDLENYFDFEKF